MGRPVLWVCFVWCFIQPANAQTVTVFDQNTRQPVADALVYNQDHTFSETTNFQGQIKIDSLAPNSQIFIDHPSYESHYTTQELLERSGYHVALRQRIITIDEVVISANRWEQDKKQTPNRIISIGPKELELRNPQTTADMLGQSGQVFIQKSQLGGGSPMIRGFAANSVLIVVDGVRMNHAIFRSGNLQNVISIDPFTLQNTEVLFGPGSVMYGSDALGGVMHFRTKSPAFLSPYNKPVGATSIVRYSSANNERTGHLDLTLRGKKISLYTSVTYSDFDHLKMGDQRTSKFPDYGKRFQYVQRIGNQDRVVENQDYNEQIYSGYNQLNILNKIRFKLGEYTDLSYTLNYSTTSDIPRYDRLLETDDNGDFISAEWYYGPQKWLSNAIHLNHYRKTSFFDGVKLIVALQNQEESRNDRDFRDDWLRSRSENVDVMTGNLDLEKELNGENTFFYGLEWFNNQVDSKAKTTNIVSGISNPIEPRYPEGGSSFSGLAVYFSHKWHPKQQFALTTGMRYNQTWLKSQYQDPISAPYVFRDFKSNHSAVNGSVGVAWLPRGNWQLNALLSTGFRAPNVDDMGKFFDGANGVVTVPNPDLKPEYTYNAEIGIIKSIKETLKLSASAFYTIMDNALVQENYSYRGLDSLYFDGETSRVQSLVNSRSSQIYGGNLQLELAITPELRFNSSFTVTRGEDSEGRPLRHTTPNFGYSGFLFQKSRFKGEINYKYSGKKRFEDLPLSEQQKTHLYTSDGSLAWQTLNLLGSYHFNPFISLTLGLENVLDQHYIPYSSGINAPGRNFIIALRGTI